MAITADRPVWTGEAGEPAKRSVITVWIAILLATLVTAFAANALTPAGDPWSARDSDDLMRMAQVRDWVAGQGYDELDQRRLGPSGSTVEGARPGGGTRMHWSRVVDLPIAGLLLAARAVGSPEPEHVAATFAPALPLLPLLAALAWGAVGLARLAGASAPLAAAGPALLLGAGWAVLSNRFAPYALDHHNWQLALLALATGLAGLALARRAHGGDGWAPALGAGVAAAAMQAIGMEMLPLTVALAGALALSWLLDRSPDPARHPLGPFALGFAAAALVALGAFVPTDRWWAIEHDVMTARHALAFAAAAGTLGLVARLTPPDARALRFACLGVAAVLGAAIAWPVLAATLSGPYDFADARIFTLWLDHVVEAAPLASRAMGGEPIHSLAAVPAVGLTATLVLLRRTPERQLAFLVPLAVLAVAIALTLWQIRAAAAAHVVAIPAIAALAAGLLVRGVAARIAGYALCVAGMQPAWAIGEALSARQGTAMAAPAPTVCRSDAAMAGLSRLPVGLVAAPSNLGAAIILHTPHTALAGPYHRNVAGFSAMFDVFATDLRTARETVVELGARYVAICPGDGDLGVMARAAPDGLAASLGSGRVPTWLDALPVADGTDLLVFAVR